MKTPTWVYRVLLIPAAGPARRLTETHPDVETALSVGEWRAQEWYPGQVVEIVVVDKRTGEAVRDRRTGEAGANRRTGGEHD